MIVQFLHGHNQGVGNSLGGDLALGRCAMISGHENDLTARTNVAQIKRRFGATHGIARRYQDKGVDGYMLSEVQRGFTAPGSQDETVGMP